MNNVEQYDREINKLFEKLESRRQMARKTIPDVNLKKYDIAFNVMAGAVCGGVGAASFHLGIPMIGDPLPLIPAVAGAVLVAGSCAVLGFFGSCNLVDRGHINPLHLLGRATSIPDYNAHRINTWVEKHPRLLGLLGRWGAKNPDGQINSADFEVLEKKMRKIGDLEMLRNQTIENEKILSQSGVTQSIKRAKLGQIGSGKKPAAGKAPQVQPKM